MRQMGNLHPMKLLMAIKLSGSSSGPRIWLFFFLFLHSTKKALWIQKKTQSCLIFTATDFSANSHCWLLFSDLSGGFSPGHLVAFCLMATNDWVTAHLSLVCWRAVRSQTFMKIVEDFETEIVVRRPKIVVEDSRCSWSLFLTDVLHELCCDSICM